MKKHLRIMGRYFVLNFASALEYRASFFSQVFGMALNNSTFIFFWWIAFDQIGGTIAGYGFRDVLFIWAVASSAFGLSHVLFGGAPGLTRLIVTGELDSFLLQPCNALLSIVCSKTSLPAYGDLLYGALLMGLVYPGNARAWGWFLAGVAAGSVLIAAITVMAHSLSFYWGDATLIGQMALEFTVNFSIYPDKIYAPAVRAIMYSVIPAGIAVHIPLRLFRSFSPGLLALAVAGGALYCAVACGFFYRALRRYESGNVIAMRS